MTESVDPSEETKEQRIIRTMKFVLTNIVKETATAPGMKHPLSDQTLMDIRQCLVLISEREREFGEQGQLDMSKRPQTPADRPVKNHGEQRIPVSKIIRKDT